MNIHPPLSKKDFAGFCPIYAAFNEVSLKNPELILNGFKENKIVGGTDVNIGKIKSNVTQADLDAFNSIFIGDKKPINNGYSEAEIFTVAYIEYKTHENLADYKNKPEKLNKIVNSVNGGYPDEILTKMLNKDENAFIEFSSTSGPIMKNSKDYKTCLAKFNKFLGDDYKNNYFAAITPSSEFGSRTKNGKENSELKKGFYTYTTMDPNGNIVTDHCYSVINIDKEKEKITLHDSNMADVNGIINGRNYVNGEFELTFEDFFKYFNAIQAFQSPKSSN